MLSNTVFKLKNNPLVIVAGCCFLYSSQVFLSKSISAEMSDFDNFIIVLRGLYGHRI